MYTCKIDLAGWGTGPFHLQNLAFDQVGERARDQLDDLVVLESRERRARSAEQKVAPEDGELVAKGRGCGVSAASEVGLVEDVVVEERCYVYHFDYLSETELSGEERMC